MPHLSIETFVTQYFWLIAILFTFYFFIVTQVVPKISEAFKTRKKLEGATVGATGPSGLSESTDFSKGVIKDRGLASLITANNAGAPDVERTVRQLKGHFAAGNAAWLRHF